MKLDSFIKNQQNKLNEIITKNFNVVIKDPFVNAVDLKTALFAIEKTIPSSIILNVDIVYIGDFPVLNLRNVQSLFENGAIYLTNKIQDQKELILSLIHEIAHAFEENDSVEYIYGDGQIEQEFLAKRLKLFNLLKVQGYTLNKKQFVQIAFDQNFDTFLKDIIGYSTLSSISNGLFLSPYGITDLREYFANAFEKFYSGQVNTVKAISPAIYNKLIEID